jgi:hypothetical protein
MTWSVVAFLCRRLRGFCSGGGEEENEVYSTRQRMGFYHLKARIRVVTRSDLKYDGTLGEYRA